MSPTGIAANRLELLQIADAVAREKSIDREVVISAIEEAIQKGARAFLHREYRWVAGFVVAVAVLIFALLAACIGARPDRAVISMAKPMPALAVMVAVLSVLALDQRTS